MLCALQLRTSAAGEEGAGLARARARLEARAAQEEELMARVPLSRAERQNLKQQRRAGLSGGAMLDDFADDIAGLVQVRGVVLQWASCMLAGFWVAHSLQGARLSRQWM